MFINKTKVKNINNGIFPYLLKGVSPENNSTSEFNTFFSNWEERDMIFPLLLIIAEIPLLVARKK